MLPAELFARLASSVFVVQAHSSGEGIVHSGSGIVVDRGCIVTAKHVMREGTSLQVARGNRIWPARVTHLDPYHDICLLLVDNLRARPVKARRYATLTVGESVYAIGAPGGGELILLEARISGLTWEYQSPEGTFQFGWMGRQQDGTRARHTWDPTVRKRWQDGTHLIRITALLRPGMSGGGLFDSEGRLIGITTVGGLHIGGGETQHWDFAITADLVGTLENHPVVGEVVVAFDSVGSQVSRLQRRALREFARGRHEAALELCRDIVTLKPMSGDAWCQLGMCYRKVGWYEYSLDAFREAVRLKPELADAWSFIAIHCIINNQLNDAVNACKKVIKLQPNNACAWLGLGEAYRGKGLRDEALMAFSEAVRLNPRSDDLHTALGLYQLDAGNYSQAILSFQEATQLQPLKAENWYRLSAASHYNGDVEKALQALHCSKELAPKLAERFRRKYRPFAQGGGQEKVRREFDSLMVFLIGKSWVLPMHLHDASL